MNSSHIILIIVLAGLSSTALGQAPSQPAADDLRTRIIQLEAKLEAITGELAKLKQQSEMKQNAVAAKKSGPPTETEPAVEAAKQRTDLGVNVGAVRLTPYGTIYFNAFGNRGGTNNTDVPFFATPTGSNNAGASVRQTRLGLRLEGVRVGDARLAAVIEADFFGGFPSVGIGENFGVVRLRLANARLDWEKTSLTIGQDWMPFAPVNPTSLAATANPPLAASGNVAGRIPQVKIERKFSGQFTWQGAVLAPQTGDAPTNAPFFLQPSSGSSSGIPFFQSRFSYANTNWFSTRKLGSAGLSGHYGRSKVFTGAGLNVEHDIESVGAALDWNFPLSERLTLMGEAFVGRNLGGFQAGVSQSYNNDFAYRRGSNLIGSGVRSIGTRGGWMQLSFTPDGFENRLGFYGSVGIDDPRDSDLISFTTRDFRRQNFSLAFDAIYKFTSQFQIGGEFRRLQTLYLISGRRTANHFNLGAAYSF